MPRILECEAAALEISRVELQPHPKAQLHPLAHGFDNSQQEPRAVFKGTTPFIIALIGQRREELADQIAMRAMDLHTVKSRFLSGFGGICKARDNRFDLAHFQPPDRREHR